MRTNKSMLGVTLLEIMLVLAIAAMVIVMSVRYYQSASANQQANGALQMIQAITAAADSLSQGSGSYSTGGVSTSTIQQLMPQNSMTAPWGGAITIGSVSGNSYSVSVASVPEQVCLLIKSRLTGNSKYTGLSSNGCTSVSTFSYTYNNAM